MMPATQVRSAVVERNQLSQIELDELASACQRESVRYRLEGASDERFALELARRAVCERDARAWEAFVTLNRDLVLATIRRQPAWASGLEDDAYWLNRTFHRFWAAVGPQRMHRFTRLPALLAYLKMCAHSVVLDEIRAQRPAHVVSLELVGEADLSCRDAVAEAIDDLAADELWRCVEHELHGEGERVIARLSWVSGLQPNEIYARHQTMFRDVADVYRMKRNLLDRLRRSPRLNDALDSVN